MKKMYVSKKTLWKVGAALLVILLGLVISISSKKKGRTAKEGDVLVKEKEMESQDTGSLDPSDTASSLEEGKEEVWIGVHVSGAVKVPDRVYFLPVGARVWDAIEKAGGAQSEADLSKLNLADYISDGQKIYVPFKGEEVDEMITEPSNVPSESTFSGLTNINSASKIELMDLPGIGETLADRILLYRKEIGPFETIEDLKQVSGIGESLFAKIKDLITV